MGLGLEFCGRLMPRGMLRRNVGFETWSRELLEAFEAVHEGFVEHALLPDGESDSAEYLLHPAAEPVFVTQEADGRVRVSARTSGVGAGYHLLLLDTLLPFFERSRFELDTDSEESFDECGVWPEGTRSSAASEMLAWRRGLARTCLESLAEGREQLSISMPVERSFSAHGAVLTPLGPRDRRWLESLAQEGDDGDALEAWSEPGFGARYWRNRALTRMWCDVCWRAPVDEREARLLDKVHRELLAAFKADPSLPLPVREWREIASFASPPLNVPVGAVAQAEGAPIGYRRNPVTHRFADWLVTVPGDFASELENDDETLHLHDAARSVFLSAATYTRADNSAVADEELLDRDTPPGSTVVKIELGPTVLCHAFLTPGDDVRVFQGVAVSNGSRAHMTVAYPDACDDGWATALFASLRRAR